MAGVYGLIAVLTGAGGSFAQLSLYVYSAIALVALGWGLRAVKEVWLRFSLSPSTYGFHPGRCEAYTLLCAFVLRRPSFLHDLDSLLQCRLVGLHSS